MIEIGTIKQGTLETLAIPWELNALTTVPASIVGATITATMINTDTGAVTAVTGTLTATGAAAFTWKLSAGDSGTAGSYLVTFKAVVGGETAYTLNAALQVQANPAATAVQNPELVGISVAKDGWLDGALTAVPDPADLVDANDLDTAAYQPATAFDAAGSAAAAQAASVAKSGDTMTGALQFSGAGHAGLRLNNLTAAQRDAITGAAGQVIFNSTDGQPQYHDGTFWRKFSSDAVALPIELDFTAMSDGALPVFTGATWAISGGEAINAPTLGSELLTDPGLEANYTSGKCDTLQTFSSPNVAQSADVHGGSKAQQFQAAANQDQLRWTTTPTTHTWYQNSIWAKRTAGTDGKAVIRSDQSSSMPQAQIYRPITAADYTQIITVHRTVSTASFFWTLIQLGAAAAYDTVIIDDGSRKAITFSDMIASVDAEESGLIVKGAINASNGLVGLVSHLDSASTPQNGIFCYAFISNIYVYVTLEKLVGGTWTQVLAPTLIDYVATYVPGKVLELRWVSTNTFAIYYNGAQISTNQTIADAGIVGNTIYGMFAAGGGSLQSFFVVAP